MTRPTTILALALACASLAPLGADAADATSLRALVDRTIQPLMAQHGVPGMAVAVSVDGKAQFFNYGLASKEQGTPVSQDTLFELGSVSKTFTATLACQARALGKLSFGDHPGQYLPSLKGSPVDKASLLELGTYTAGGLPLQFPDAVENDAQAMAYYRAWQPDAAPGVQRRYSNPSIGLFGRAAAAALGEDFGAAIEARLLPALGLSHTYLRVPDGAQARYAWGYDKEGKPVRVSAGPFDAEAYGLKSSSADMIRYVQANIDPGKAAPPLRSALACTHEGWFQVGGMVQGLGWEQYRGNPALPVLLAGNSSEVSAKANPVARVTATAAPPGTLFNKTGATRGFGAYVLFVPDLKIGIVMLANKNYPNAARVEAAHAILEGMAH